MGSTALMQNLNQINSQDTVFEPKLLKFMVMMPTDNSDQSTNQDFLPEGVTDITNNHEEVSPSKIVDHMLHDFSAKGGSMDNAHIVSQSENIKNHYKKLVLEFSNNQSGVSLLPY